MSDEKRTNGAFEVRRRISLSSAITGSLQDAVRKVRAMAPIHDAHVGSDGALHLRYDASRIGLRQIETILEESGVAPANGFWARRKLAWYRFLDDNAVANANNHAGACCNRPPPLSQGNAGTKRRHQG